jgi:hypothetical protein
VTLPISPSQWFHVPACSLSTGESGTGDRDYEPRRLWDEHMARVAVELIGSGWKDDPTWYGLNGLKERARSFRYKFMAVIDTEGFGSCHFTSQAIADLDTDGRSSTFERSGATDINGVNAAASLYINREVGWPMLPTCGYEAGRKRCRVGGNVEGRWAQS